MGVSSSTVGNSLLSQFCLMSHPPLDLLASATAAFASIARTDITGTKVRQGTGTVPVILEILKEAVHCIETP